MLYFWLFLVFVKFLVEGMLFWKMNFGFGGAEKGKISVVTA